MNTEAVTIFAISLIVSFYTVWKLSLGRQKKFHLPPEGTAVFIKAVLGDGSFVAEILGKKRYYKGNVSYRGSMNHKYLFCPEVGTYVVRTMSERYCPGALLYWDELQKI